MTLQEINQRLYHTDFFVSYDGKKYVVEDHGGLDFGPFLMLKSESLYQVERFLKTIGALV